MTAENWVNNFKNANVAIKSAIIELINRFHNIADDQKYLHLSLNITSLEKLLIEILNVLIKDKETINVAVLSFMEKRLPIIDELTTQFLENPNESTKQRFELYTQRIEQEYLKLKNIVENENANNTEDYYNKNINDLQSRIDELQKKLSTESLKNENANNLIKNLTVQKESYQRELDLKKRQEDAKRNWKKNIDETFSELEGYLFPIKNEKDRLNKLFWVYLIASCVLVLVVALIEIIAIVKITKSPAFPDFKQYITLFLPIPIVGAMLWAFIYQMNRAQRQLIVIAKSIHKVEYVQGLLLAINKLAPNVEDGITRINLALDKLVSNHLNEKEINSEEDIIKEEKKDIVPVDSLIKILKELKGVVGKE